MPAEGRPWPSGDDDDRRLLGDQPTRKSSHQCTDSWRLTWLPTQLATIVISWSNASLSFLTMAKMMMTMTMMATKRAAGGGWASPDLTSNEAALSRLHLGENGEISMMMVMMVIIMMMVMIIIIIIIKSANWSCQCGLCGQPRDRVAKNSPVQWSTFTMHLQWTTFKISHVFIVQDTLRCNGWKQ